MKRREFVNFVGLGGIAFSLPVAIAACTPTDTAAETEPAADDTATEAPAVEEVDSTVRDDGFAALGTVSELDSAGFLASKDFTAGPVIVIRDPADAAGIVSLNSMCPHQGCNVDWKESEFVCPCHGSKFTADGEVTSGPANEALSSYEAMIDGDLVLVKAA